MSTVIDINKEEFKELIKDNEVVMADFYAEWCGPCKMLSPIMDELETEYKDKIKVCKINVDSNSDLASEFGISALPAVLIFKSSEVLVKHIGLKTKKDLKNDIDRAL